MDIIERFKRNSKVGKFRNGGQVKYSLGDITKQTFQIPEVLVVGKAPRILDEGEFDGTTVVANNLFNPPSVVQPIDEPSESKLEKVPFKAKLNRKQTRQVIRELGGSPYLDLDGTQRKALRKYINGDRSEKVLNIVGPILAQLLKK